VGSATRAARDQGRPVAGEARDEHVHVHADELVPGCGRLALWNWSNTMPLQDIPTVWSLMG
jgi:hypothetical protein